MSEPSLAEQVAALEHKVELIKKQIIRYAQKHMPEQAEGIKNRLNPLWQGPLKE